MSAANSVSTKSFDYNTANCLVDDIVIYGASWDEGESIYNVCLAAFNADWMTHTSSPPPSLSSRKIAWLTQAEALLLLLKEAIFKKPKEKSLVPGRYNPIPLADLPHAFMLIKIYHLFKDIQVGSGFLNRFAILLDRAIPDKQLSHHEFRVIRNNTFSSFLSSTFKYTYGPIVKTIPDIRDTVTRQDFSATLSFYEKAWSRYDTQLESYSKRLSAVLPHQFNQANINSLIAFYATSYADNFEVVDYFNRFLKTFGIQLNESVIQTIEMEERKSQFEAIFLESLIWYFSALYGNGEPYESILNNSDYNERIKRLKH